LPRKKRLAIKQEKKSQLASKHRKDTKITKQSWQARKSKLAS
jgi:hypothetical protein